jgi:hypothetical protein
MKKIMIVLAAALLLFPAAGARAQETLNKKNLVVKEWNTTAKGTKTLDHVTTYSPEGKKIEEIEYDASGKQKWRKRYEWGTGEKMSRELVYDERNRLVNYKKFEYNELGKKKIQYTYNPKGKLISTKVYEYVTQDA